MFWEFEHFLSIVFWKRNIFYFHFNFDIFEENVNSNIFFEYFWKSPFNNNAFL